MTKTTTSLMLIALLGAAAVHAQVPNLFITSDRCMACHNSISSPRGEVVSMGVGWRSSMMANSARDPYWQAAVRREIMEHPTARAAIENGLDSQERWSETSRLSSISGGA